MNPVIRSAFLDEFLKIAVSKAEMLAALAKRPKMVPAVVGYTRKVVPKMKPAPKNFLSRMLGG